MIFEIARRLLEIETKAVSDLLDRLDDRFACAVGMLLSRDGRVLSGTLQ